MCGAHSRVLGRQMRLVHHLDRLVVVFRPPGSSLSEPSSPLVSSAPPPVPLLEPELPSRPGMPVPLAADITTSLKGGVTPRARWLPPFVLALMATTILSWFTW